MMKWFVLLLVGTVSAQVDFDQHLDISPEEYQKRRLELREKLDHPVVMMGNISRNRINDTEYEFRQESSFYYLTGYNEPGAFLILSPKPFEFKGKMVHEVLFLKALTPRGEIYLGERTTPESAMKELGFEMAAPVDEGHPYYGKFINHFENYLKSFASTHRKFYLTTPIINYHEFGNARPSYADSYKRALTDALNADTENDQEEQPPLEVLSAGPVLDHLRDMRAIKSETERKLLQRAVDITLSGHRESLRIAKDVPYEYQVEAAIEYAFKYNGAAAVGYNSIVGCGPNGTVLHYESNRDAANPNQMYVLDAGAEYNNYTADITRSFPADGTFSKEQREIYELVLASQTAGAKQFVAGSNYQKVLSVINEVLSSGLVKLGLIKYPVVEKKVSELNMASVFGYHLTETLEVDGEILGYAHTPVDLRKKNLLDPDRVLKLYDAGQFRQACPHGWGHSVGLDVHDPAPRTFAEGTIWTIEPGVYLAHRLDFEIPENYYNIGVRIEDMYLITKDGNICMSEELPREVDQLEAFMKEKSHLLLRQHKHHH